MCIQVWLQACTQVETLKQETVACLVLNLCLISLSSGLSIQCNNCAHSETFGKSEKRDEAIVLWLANGNLLFLKVQSCECVSQAPHGLFVYFQRTVGGEEQMFKPGQDGDVL